MWIASLIFCLAITFGSAIFLHDCSNEGNKEKRKISNYKKKRAKRFYCFALFFLQPGG